MWLDSGLCGASSVPAWGSLTYSPPNVPIQVTAEAMAFGGAEIGLREVRSERYRLSYNGFLVSAASLGGSLVFWSSLCLVYLVLTSLGPSGSWSSLRAESIFVQSVTPS